MENHLPEVTENRLPRLTVKEIRNETLLFFNLEKGLLFTFLALIKDPKNTIDVYLNINRRKFSNPLSYILIGIGLYVILLNVSPSFISYVEYFKGLNAEMLTARGQNASSFLEAQTKSQEIIFSYQNVFYMVAIPLISFITLWLCSDRKFNYAENLAINSFAFGTSTWTAAFLCLLTVYIDYPIVVMPIIILSTFVILIYSYKKIFEMSWIMSIFITVLIQGILIGMSAVIQAALSVYFMIT